MAFLDDMIFPQLVSMGEFEGDIERVSVAATNQGGFRQTILVWDRSLRSYQAGLVVRPLNQWREIERFWESCDGNVHQWRLQDPFGYQCAAGEGFLWPIDADGDTVDDVGFGNGGTPYRLFRQTGNPLHPRYREIRKPFGTIVIKKNGSTVTPTLDMNTGIATFSAAPTGADVLTWSGNFHTPCQFLDTKLKRAVKARQQGGELLVNTPSIMIVEARL